MGRAWNRGGCLISPYNRVSFQITLNSWPLRTSPGTLHQKTSSRWCARERCCVSRNLQTGELVRKSSRRTRLELGFEMRRQKSVYRKIVVNVRQNGLAKIYIFILHLITQSNTLIIIFSSWHSMKFLRGISVHNCLS